ncbi:hypothetical protein OIE68_00580 [Nocardia vinacea]|uniref:hypothetical protein n=1 Tax=Nocardia vinacea TaxID=96468 RepID=UPI002E0FB1AF|nr:hypothetical protein OIE68_00580 [Nocardia vinacea]
MNDIEAHRTLVDRVTLRVPAGRVHALPGPDGSRISFTAAAFLAIPGIFDVIAHGQTGTSTSSGPNIDVLDWMNVRYAEGAPAKNYLLVRDDGNIIPPGQHRCLARGDEWERSSELTDKQQRIASTGHSSAWIAGKVRSSCCRKNEKFNG